MNIGEHIPTISKGFPTPALWNRMANTLNCLRSIGLGPNMIGKMNNAGIFLDAKASGGGVVISPTGTWAIALDDLNGIATISNRISWRGGKTEIYDGDVIVELPSSTTVYVCEHYNTVTGDSTIVASTTPDIDTEVPPKNVKISKTLLYVLKGVISGAKVAWSIKIDCRNQIVRGLYR